MTGAPLGYISPLAVIGDPPEHRDFRALDHDAFFRPMIQQSALLEAFVTVDSGTVRHTLIGRRTWLGKHVHIGHDAVVGDDCEIMAGTVIAGHVDIGDGVRIGIGATVKPFVMIGAGARIGMGAVVIRDVPAGEVWAGNPARELRVRESVDEVELHLGFPVTA